MFRIDKLTQKAQDALQQCQVLAEKNGSQVMYPLHLLISLAEEEVQVTVETAWHFAPSQPRFVPVGAPDEQAHIFDRFFTTREQRWMSPKFLCGESYGGIRAAGLADFLQGAPRRLQLGDAIEVGPITLRFEAAPAGPTAVFSASASRVSEP